VLDRPSWLDAARGEAPSAYRQQAHPTFVLAEDAYWAGILRRDDTLQLLLTGRLKRLHGVRVFLCDWAAAP
jgi:hypothetical protein